MDVIQDMLPRVQAYLDQRQWRQVPIMQGRRFTAEPLAQGEYNLNYLISSIDKSIKLVFRVNIGTQINRTDQIAYEYKTLELLKDSDVTPKPYFVDENPIPFDRGILIMEFIPGETLDYSRDLNAAAGLFGNIHQIQVNSGNNHLIREDAPLSQIYDECKGLLNRYFESDLAEPDIRDYLKEIIHWADCGRSKEKYFQQDPWSCIINTEVNSGNFIVNRRQGTIHLVDWEMPRWGDPSQDICHFCSPLTTLWKTNYRMSESDKRNFIDTYMAALADRHLKDTLVERIRLREPFVYLRGISWSAMGWVAYQTAFDGVKNPDTWSTLKRYMQLDFIRELFDPIVNSG